MPYFIWTGARSCPIYLPVKNANVSKNSLRLALAVTLLFGGVVFEAASVGSATGGVPLPPRKPSQAVLASAGSAAAQKATTYKPNALTDEELSASDRTSPAYGLLYTALREELRQGRPSYALKVLQADPLSKNLKNSEYDRLRAVIAQSYMVEGKLDKAKALAESAVARSGTQVPLAGWIGGLSAWRLGDYKTATRHFSTVAHSPVASDWLQSAGAFWASRAALRSGQFRQVDDLLEIAADHPRTFYGLIAIRALSRDYDFNWSEPSLTRRDRARLQADAQVAEAFRQAGEGQLNAAAETLARSGWMNDRARREQLLAYSLKNYQTALALHIARQTKDAHGNFYDAALYPVMKWQPKSGYKIDKALVYALIRQESRFNAGAKSGTGATGLMQLLPATARFMNDGEDVALTSPELNLDVGQKYISHLLNDSAVNNDLFMLMVAYNAGPGNLARWKESLSDVKDPLLFIESIPSAETRAFVERVMVNYWIYRIRMDQDTPSLDAIADGDQQEYAEAGRLHKAVRLASK